MEQKKEFIGTKAALLSFLDNSIGLTLGIILHMLLSRFLGIRGYGQFTMIYSILFIFTSIVTPGIVASVTYHVSSSKNFKSIFLFAIRLEILVDIFLCILYLLMVDVICDFLSIVILKPYIMMSSLIIMPEGLTKVIISYFKGRLDFMKVFCLNLSYVLLRFIFCSSMLFWGFGLSGVVVGLVLSQALVFLIALFMVKIERFQAYAFHGEVLRMAFPIWIIAVSSTLMRRMDVLCIRYFLADYQQVACYASANRIIDVLVIFVFIPSVFLFPMLSRLIKNKNFLEAQKVLERCVRYTFLPSTLLCFWLFLNSKSIINFIFTPKFSNGASVLSIFCVSWIFISILRILNKTILSSGLSSVYLKFNFLPITLNLILNILLIPRFGINGAAVATVFSHLFPGSMLFLYAYFKGHLPKRKLIWIDKLTLLRVIIIIVIIGVFHKYMLVSQGFVNFIVKSILACIIYFVLLFALGETNEEDRRILRALRAKIVTVLQNFKIN